MDDTPERHPREPTIFTIGHSTRSIETLVELLHAHRIERLMDVRTVPRSGRNPQFNRETLPETLRASGIGYAHVPALGGLRHPRPDSINTGWRHAGFSSTHNTDRAAPALPTPTSAVRNTAGCTLNTPSQGIVNSVPVPVSTRCDFRPHIHRRPLSSK